MEVSTVFPPPASLTKGEYLCEIDLTTKAIGAVTLVISACGLVGNGAVLCLLGFFIRRKHITVYIFHMAITDFIFLFLMVLSILLFVRDNKSCYTSLSMTYPILILELFLLFYNLGLYLLAAICMERCRSTFCPLWCLCHHPQHRSMVLSMMLLAISITVIPILTSLFQSSGNYMVVFDVLLYLHLLLFVSTMVMSSTILFIKVTCGSQQEQSKRLDIIIFLMVLFGLPSSLYNFLTLIRDTLLSFPVLFLLACIHSTSKPFICFLVVKCWRHCSTKSLWLSLQKVFEEQEENTTSSNDATTDTVL